MIGQFKQYFINLYQDIPQEAYKFLFAIFCVGACLFFVCKRGKMKFRFFIVLLLIEYIFLLFYSTIIHRTTVAVKRYDFHPFWSYSRPDLLVENVMNVIVFIPIGLLLAIAFKQMIWWKALLIGCGISVTIEAFQFFLMRGFSEVDDVMHNTLGCLLGYILVKGSRLMV